MASTEPTMPVAPVVEPCRGGLLAWLWNLIGSTTPAYSGKGHPAPGRGWCNWGSTTPTYQVAPPAEPSTSEGDGEQTDEDPGDGAKKVVAVVIRRE